MLFIYALLMLFYSWFVAIKYYKSNKKGILVNEYKSEYTKKLLIILSAVFLLLLFWNSYQCSDFIISIFNSDIESLIDLPMEIEKYSIYGDIGLSVLKILWLPSKLLKYLLRVVFGVCSIFVYFSHFCVKNLVNIPKWLRNILYSLCFLDIIYILVAIF